MGKANPLVGALPVRLRLEAATALKRYNKAECHADRLRQRKHELDGQARALLQVWVDRQAAKAPATELDAVAARYRIIVEQRCSLLRELVDAERALLAAFERAQAVLRKLGFGRAS
ncbi:hypothetical protein CN071_31805 [Sinorhizobium meliloti]|nr:hypothetical protein SMRU11_08155 [Sinorhizobium meliloti RU11/001]ASP69600.1 hypothetical protein CDO29_35030 [Sinorhizobium meliloti]RVE78178.1 hypothetical protein CN235_35170 [Sinorhizobium meliloti]RVE80902.1 hypothetical protein CN238_30595 [Sinorhizobium meliloti]RVG04945.1 hypothetical protein CN234_26405 [Sinorhizobium meliloti]